MSLRQLCAYVYGLLSAGLDDTTGIDTELAKPEDPPPRQWLPAALGRARLTLRRG